MECVAAFIVYCLFIYILIKFSNTQSFKSLRKEVFEIENQIFLWIALILASIGILINHNTTFATIMKVLMYLLALIDIGIYLISKFKEFPFGWALWSIVLDILVFPIGFIVVVSIWAAIMSLFSRSNNCDIL